MLMFKFVAITAMGEEPKHEPNSAPRHEKSGSDQIARDQCSVNKPVLLLIEF